MNLLGWLKEIWRKWASSHYASQPQTISNELIRPGDYWCDRHWARICISQRTDNSIDPNIAAMGLAAAIYLKRGEQASALKLACEMVPEDIMEGIFERSQGWV